MSNIQQNSPSINGSQASEQIFSIRVPKSVKKKFHVMRFNSVLNVEFNKWNQVKMERENNSREFSRNDDEVPKFGAGSEYGREAKEEARRRKYGTPKRYKPEDQPWILKAGGKTGKKFKGIREGGIAENASYYVFTHGADGSLEAYPLREWYNFTPIQRFKALSAEEAEEEFGRRNKVMNYFSLMCRKRLKNEDDLDGDDEENKPKKGKKHSSDFTITEMDEWINSEDETDSDDDDEEKKEKPDKKKKITAKKKPKKKRKGSDDSAVEESDDGDEEGRELDYISDSSESESEPESKLSKEMKGVAEETALRRLLNSDEDDEDDEEEETLEDKKEENKDENNSNNNKEHGKEGKELKDKKRKRPKTKGDKKDNDGSSSDSSSDSSESENESKSKSQNVSLPETNETKVTEASTSTSNTNKKPKLDIPNTALSFGGDNGITEYAVRRYLMRKPMTATELLQKFKGRKTGLTSEQLVNVMTQILKRINPIKQTIKGKLHFWLKPTP